MVSTGEIKPEEIKVVIPSGETARTEMKAILEPLFEVFKRDWRRSGKKRVALELESEMEKVFGEKGNLK